MERVSFACAECKKKSKGLNAEALRTWGNTEKVSALRIARLRPALR